MAITAQSIIQRVVDTLQDPTSIRWPVDELVRYLNDAQRQIILHRPDASSKALAHTLVAGSAQELPTDGAKLLDVIGNSGGTKRGVTLIRDRKILDVTIPGWHALTGATEILHYLYDERDPQRFHVYPPAAASGASLNIVYSPYPSDITQPGAGSLYDDVTGSINLPDIQLAQVYMASFANSLGIEIQATVSNSPRTAVTGDAAKNRS